MAIQTLSEALERFQPVIGLEVHAQLLTESKLFSRAPNAFVSEANVHITPYCVGLPGVLPVVNQRAVELAATAGLALGCTVHSESIWSRKQYFYPDLPKGYQISQYDRPICTHGELEIDTPNGPRAVHIDRIHMEEDAGKSIHLTGLPSSVVDFNRAGVPLIEIVSAPDLFSAQEAGDYLRKLRAILRTLQISDGNLEEGSFRCDANVSLRPHESSTLGQRTELKNINSFRYVEQAIGVEILRQAQLLEAGHSIEQETRLFDSAKRETRSMRSKEEAPDYRYFPDPDLPPLYLAPARIEALRQNLPELPAARLARYLALGLPDEDATLLSEERALSDFFDAAIEGEAEHAVAIAALIKNELLREIKAQSQSVAEMQLRPKDLSALVKAKEAKKLSSSQQKKIFLQLFREGGDAEALIAQEGGQLDDAAALLPIIETLVAEHPKEAESYRAGKTKVISFFIGQVMRQTRGKASPEAVKSLLESVLTK